MNDRPYADAPGIRVLLVEDEIRIADFVIPALSAAGFEVSHVNDGADGLAAILDDAHDVVVLDVMLPSMDGFAILARVREAGNRIPVIILSARGELPDRLLGFETGADDYLPKPFFVEELVARIRAVLARKAGTQSDNVSIGGLSINKISRQASWNDTVAQLSQREFSLLEYLMRAPDHIFSRKQILRHVWGISFNPETNIVDVCIQRIRRKLNRQNGGGASFPIETIRGVGYCFRPKDSP